jgi:hypothetical protein
MKIRTNIRAGISNRCTGIIIKSPSRCLGL